MKPPKYIKFVKKVFGDVTYVGKVLSRHKYYAHSYVEGERGEERYLLFINWAFNDSPFPSRKIIWPESGPFADVSEATEEEYAVSLVMKS